MSFSCALQINVSNSSNSFNVDVPKGLNRPTIDAIMSHISTMDPNTCEVQIALQNGRILIETKRQVAKVWWNLDILD